MNKKSFFLGVLTGIVLAFVGLFAIGLVNQNSSDPIQYLEQPVSYENKTETSIKVFQVLGNATVETFGRNWRRTYCTRESRNAPFDQSRD